MKEPKRITLGTAASQPGTIQYGRWEAFEHPTGQTEFLPVIIAQGKNPGPCFWLTAGIHGPEHTGPVVIYKLLTPELVAELQGTIIAVPALSPAGLRTHTYQPYHVGVNPNRLWPDGKPRPKLDPEKHPPYSLEIAYQRLFEEILASADFLIDYHNAWTDSLSFVFRDRVLYHARQGAEKNKAEALAEQQDAMIRAYGHTVVTEYPADRYIKEDLHRSTSGAALLVGRIPSFTVELGTGHMPDPAIVNAALAGTRNVLRWAGMLPGKPEPITGIRMADPGFRVRRTLAARAPLACVGLHLVEAGTVVKQGDALAELRDVWGRPVGEGVLRTEHDGVVVGWAHGIYHYPGDTLVHLAIRDDAPLVAPYPEEFYKDDSDRTDDYLKS